MQAGGGGGTEFESVFRASYPRVLRAAYVVVADWEVAHELAQDAFVQLLRHWEKVSGYDEPGAWVRRVAIRLAVRHRSRRPLLFAAPEPRDASRATEVHVDLMRAISTLSPTQRAAVVLHYLEDLPVARVAEELRCSEATAKVHLFRARNRLAGLLGESEGVV